MSRPRFELADLADALGVSFDTDERGHCRGITAMATLLGVDRPTVRNWRVRGIPAHIDLDAVAMRHGLYAEDVWPHWLADHLDDEGEPGYFADDPSLDELEHQRKDSAA